MTMQDKAIVLDLDNTLYSWIDAYSKSFQAQVEFIVESVNVDKLRVLNSFKKVFALYGSVEIPDAVLKLDLWQELEFNKEQVEHIQDVAYNLALVELKKNLIVFPGVRETLEWCKNNNILVFGFSDAFAYWVNIRLKILNLFEYFNKVYTNNNDAILSSHLVQDANINDKIYQLLPCQNKPNIDVFNIIAKKYCILYENIYMVGDSIEKDIIPAQKAGVIDIWARYGTRHGKCPYLKQVTPWKKKPHGFINVQPTYIVNRLNDVINILKVFD